MKTKTFALTMALLMTLSAAAGLVVMAGEDSYADAPELPVDEVWFWTVQIYSTATNAEDVKWDFGDGSPVLDSRDQGQEGYDAILAANGGDVWNPVHTYPQVKGEEYILTQTVYNSYQGGSQDSMSSIMRIMGPPTVTFVGEDIDIDPVSVPYDENWISQPVTAPEDPEREGYAFEGWYTDEDFEDEYNFASKVRKDLTLYAKWSVEVVTYTVTVISAEGPETYEVEEGGALSDVYITAPGGTTAFYLNEELTEIYDADEIVTEDITVYAVYTATAAPPASWWPEFEWPTIEWPTINWPTIEWPSVAWPTIEWPVLEWPALPAVPTAEEAKVWAEDNAVSIGAAAAGILALVAALIVRRPIVFVITVALFAVAGVGFAGVVDFQSIIEGFPWW